MKHIPFYIVAFFTFHSVNAYGQNVPQMHQLNIPPFLFVNVVDNDIPGTITNTVTLPTPYNVGDNSPGWPNKPLNFSRIFVPQQPITDINLVNETSYASVVKLSTEYTDGFGRVMQRITRRPNLFNYDNVECYDHRPSNKSYSYLPYSINTYSFITHFQTSPFSADIDYYSSLFPNEAGTAFKESEYISDANSRSSISYNVGKSNVGQRHGTTSTTKLNGSNEIIIWDLDNTANHWPIKKGYYSEKQLTKKIMQDADGAYMEAVYDIDNKLICKSLLANYTDCDVDHLEDPNLHAPGINGPPQQCPTYLWTYYVYDFFGKLRYTLSPKAIQKLSVLNWVPTADIINNLCDYSVYDALGRIVETHTAGKNGNESYVYDRHNRIVLTQDPNSALGGAWKFTLYDRFNRATVTGVNWTSYVTRQTWQSLFDDNANITQFQNNQSILEHYLLFDDYGQYPASLDNSDMYTYTFYDNYNFPSNLYNNILASLDYVPSIFTGNLTNDAFSVIPDKSNNTNGKVTGKLVRVLKPDNATVPFTDLADWLPTVYYYDDYGRLIESVGENQRTGLEITGHQYDFVGKLLNTIKRHDNSACIAHPENNIVTRFGYSFGVRNPYSIIRNIDNTDFRTLAVMDFNSLGQLRSKVIGGIETQNYTYNIRGQINGINPDYADFSVGNFAFGESIKYDNCFSHKLFNGAITGIIWKGAGNTPSRAYGYTYDNAGRLTQSDFTEYSDVIVQQPPFAYITRYWNNVNNDYTEGNISYDYNGNIQTLWRKGLTNNNNIIAPDYVDKLKYSYEKNDVSNRVQAVTDDINLNNQYTDYDFKDNNQTSTDYKYDDNGNLIVDENKSATTDYYLINKPQKITLSNANGESITYAYDAEGNKLMEHKTSYYTDETTEYMDEFVYKDNDLYLINHPEGYARVEQNDYTNYFFVKDHLGNVRSILKAVPENIGPNDLNNVLNYFANHEVAAANLENSVFENIDNVRANKPDPNDSTDTRAAVLDANDSNKRVGTTIMLKMMAGDKFDVGAESYYEASEDSVGQVLSPEEMLNSILSALAGGSTNLASAEGTSTSQYYGNLFSENNYSIYNDIINENTDTTLPRAYLNYIFYDENFNIVRELSSAIQISDPANQWNTLGTQQPIDVSRNGYLLTFITNAEVRIPAAFDHVHVNHYRGQLVEENHYFPFGLTVNTASMNPITNSYLYQSKQLEKTGGLNLNDFNARNYDPQLGRFISLDPDHQFFSGYIGMGNFPSMGIDLDGRRTFISNGMNMQSYDMGVEYVRGSLMFGGKPYTGNDAFIMGMKGILDQLQAVIGLLSFSYPELAMRLSFLLNDDPQKHLITPIDQTVKTEAGRLEKERINGKNYYEKSDWPYTQWGYVDFIKFDMKSDKVAGVARDKYIGFWHEWGGHVYNHATGKVPVGSVNGVPLEEIDATRIEDVLRDCTPGLHIRTNYGGREIPLELVRPGASPLYVPGSKPTENKTGPKTEDKPNPGHGAGGLGADGEGSHNTPPPPAFVPPNCMNNKNFSIPLIEPCNSPFDLNLNKENKADRRNQQDIGIGFNIESRTINARDNSISFLRHKER